MRVATRSGVQCGTVPWPSRRGTRTIVLKRTFELVAQGVAPTAAEAEPLRLDRAEPSGVLLFPTDFAPMKGRCDVVVVGSALLEDRPARLVLAGVDKRVPRVGALGPRAGVGDAGDPTDPEVAEAWGKPGFDPEQFQCAPADQRLAPPSPPIDLVLELGEELWWTRLDARAPAALLIDRGGRLPAQRVATRIDTVLVDPILQRVAVVWRAVIDLAPDADVLLAVDPDGPLDDPALAATWSQISAVEPAFLRRMARLSGGGTAMVSARPHGAATVVLADDPSVQAPDAKRAVGPRLTLDGAAPAAPALPFAPGAAPQPTRKRLAQTIDAPIDAGATAVASSAATPFRDGPVDLPPPAAGRSPRIASGTVDAASALADAVREAVTAASRAAAPPPPVTPPVTPPMASPPSPAEASTTDSGRMTREQMVAIKTAVWSGESLAAVLARHGLTEIEWAVAQRAFIARRGR